MGGTFRRLPFPAFPILRSCAFCGHARKKGGNVMVSPFSLYEVLRDMLPGVAGETERRIAAILPGDGANQEGLDFSV